MNYIKEFKVFNRKTEERKPSKFFSKIGKKFKENSIIQLEK